MLKNGLKSTVPNEKIIVDEEHYFFVVDDDELAQKEKEKKRLNKWLPSCDNGSCDT